MHHVHPRDLCAWCRIPAEELPQRSDLKIPLRLVTDSREMGELMARELVELIESNNGEGRDTRAIIPCGPSCWYEPWRRLVNERSVSLERFTVFHMDECLDWQGCLLPKNHPYNFRTFMEREFYSGIPERHSVPAERRMWLSPSTMDSVREEIRSAPIDLALGGWGQDGHIAYNQSRRHPYSSIGLEELAQSSIRIQENNFDTILALANRTLGTAYQLVPPMSVTLGVHECLSARRVRVFSDTGAWKQTALRVALFSEPVTEYPITLLQNHPDALITATVETAQHPLSDHPEWEFF